VDRGGLLEVGTHDELLARRGRYADLFAAWTSATHQAAS
jgi:ABC-type multidrug transport system fused ATPase/permease subunit